MPGFQAAFCGAVCCLAATGLDLQELNFLRGGQQQPSCLDGFPVERRYKKRCHVVDVVFDLNKGLKSLTAEVSEAMRWFGASGRVRGGPWLLVDIPPGGLPTGQNAGVLGKKRPWACALGFLLLTRLPEAPGCMITQAALLCCRAIPLVCVVWCICLVRGAWYHGFFERGKP